MFISAAESLLDQFQINLTEQKLDFKVGLRVSFWTGVLLITEYSECILISLCSK